MKRASLTGKFSPKPARRTTATSPVKESDPEAGKRTPRTFNDQGNARRLLSRFTRRAGRSQRRNRADLEGAKAMFTESGDSLSTIYGAIFGEAAVDKAFRPRHTEMILFSV